VKAKVPDIIKEAVEKLAADQYLIWCAKCENGVRVTVTEKVTIYPPWCRTCLTLRTIYKGEADERNDNESFVAVKLCPQCGFWMEPQDGCLVCLFCEWSEDGI